jgi:ABC-type metal ion transport system substrate-binding protein
LTPPPGNRHTRGQHAKSHFGANAGPYANLIAVRAADVDRPWAKVPVESYQTPEVRDFILTKFKGAVLSAW